MITSRCIIYESSENDAGERRGWTIDPPAPTPFGLHIRDWTVTSPENIRCYFPTFLLAREYAEFKARYDWADDPRLGAADTLARFEELGPDVAVGPENP